MYRQVYVITDDTGAYKIGFTQSMDSRLASLQVGNPRLLRIIMSVTCLNAASIERDLHKHFANKRLRGEWFALTQEDLNYISSLLTRVNMANDDPIIVGARTIWACPTCGMLIEHQGFCDMCSYNIEG